MISNRFFAVAFAVGAAFVPVAVLAAAKTTAVPTTGAPIATKVKSSVPSDVTVAAVVPVTRPQTTQVAPVGGGSTKVRKVANAKTVVPAKIVIAGNVCKKILIGRSSHDKVGAVLKCVVDAKGQPRWTK
jgi:hypothetical protein